MLIEDQNMAATVKADLESREWYVFLSDSALSPEIIRDTMIGYAELFGWQPTTEDMHLGRAPYICASGARAIISYVALRKAVTPPVLVKVLIMNLGMPSGFDIATQDCVMACDSEASKGMLMSFVANVLAGTISNVASGDNRN